MAIETLTSIPDAFEQGDTVLFTEVFADFPATTWTAFLILARNGERPVRFDATAASDPFSWTLTTAQTAAVAPGWWNYAFYVTYSGQRATAKSGTIAVLDNLAIEQPLTFNQTQVQVLQTALASLAASTDSTVSFNGQSFSRSSIDSYRSQLVYFQSQVIADQKKLDALRGTAQNSFVGTRFTPTAGLPFGGISTWPYQ